ncbi:MAG: group II intron reverse transcriptase/maturase, partial [Spirochaetia bacterium]|nr:group II intron reverse transcriptase/maturase [Spirochaetia bacterium]
MEIDEKGLRELSCKHKRVQTLMHYVNKKSLIEEHRKQCSRKAVGVDSITKEAYGAHLDANISNLLERMKSFSYQPKPVRRTYIPKGNGKTRPLGIPSYEDKLVQGVMAKVLNDVYEP